MRLWDPIGSKTRDQTAQWFGIAGGSHGGTQADVPRSEHDNTQTNMARLQLATRHPEWQRLAIGSGISAPQRSLQSLE